MTATKPPAEAPETKTVTSETTTETPAANSAAPASSGSRTLEQLFTSRVAALVPEVIDAKEAAAVRQRLERAGYARYALIDRGSYERLIAPAEPQLLARLQAAAAKATGRSLQLAGALALRLGPGDYLLAHHDPYEAREVRAAQAVREVGAAPGGPTAEAGDDHDGDDGLVELMLDLSPAEVPGAEVHYRRGGRPFFLLPSQPGALSVVERDADVRCNHSYVSKRHQKAQVVRLVLRLRPA